MMIKIIVIIMITVINRILMECYYNSNPQVVGYVKRMNIIWKEKKCLI